MNAVNHLLFALSLSLFFFGDRVSLKSILILVIIFSVLIDMDQLISLYRKKIDDGHLRTWFQEPIGFFLFIVPFAWVISIANPLFFPLILLCVASHIVLDYLTFHHVRPLGPFSKKRKVGFFRSYPPKAWEKKHKFLGISELYFLGLNLIFFMLVI